MIKTDNEIWDGRSGTRKSDKYAAPDASDWQRIIGEMIKTQEVVVTNNNVYSNDAGVIILAGQPLILVSNIQLANPLNPEVIGISIADCIVSEKCTYVNQGRLSLENWLHSIGTIKLVPGAYYYLSPSQEGKLTLIPPNNVGETIVQIGRAQNEDTLSINIQMPLYL